MRTLHFRCELLTDVVFNQRAATEGGQETLDFIPGNNFLGIAAGKLYDKLKPEESLLLFHSGKVRFGDAHPGKNGKRSTRIPASIYKPKLGDMCEKGLYIHHEVTNPDALDYKNFQPKQCRTGFYLFENEQMEEVKVEKSYTQKSAYDSKMRRSADEKMFGYEALQAESSWLFEVTLEDNALKFEGQIIDALKGEKRVGRSRTAQYGLVKIEHIKSEDVNKINIKPLYNEKNKYSYILIYAESRLIFLDEYGLPTFQPTLKDLGFSGAKIAWGESQIRTFQYSPWNFKRQVRDADRCGIEKGSVFYVIVPSDKEINVQSIVGDYQNEGFGKVIYNPEFLKVESKSNGKALYKLTSQKESQRISKKPKKLDIDESDTVLLRYLKIQNNIAASEQEILKNVNIFVEKNKKKYTMESFASQWGTIRSIAMQKKTKKEIMEHLFGTDTKGIIKPKDYPDGYLHHGVAFDKWDERERRDDFKIFIEQFSNSDFRSAIINLSAEMAKISKKQ